MSSNMRPLAVAVAKAGILDENMMSEFLRWGLPIEDMPVGPKPASTEELVASLEEALQSEGLVIERVTDFEIVKQYLQTQQVGVLHVEIGQESSDFDVPYGRSKLGEYILPWKGDSVMEEMTNGRTYLVDNNMHVYFQAVRELFFGETKAFMACLSSTIETGHDHS